MRSPSAAAAIAANGSEFLTRHTTDLGDLALVMSGGGARAAYQVGLLRHLARRHPQLEIPIITGVSAGAVNAALLARHHGTFPQAVEELTSLWLELTPDRVFRVDTLSLAGKVVRAGVQLASGGAAPAQHMRGMVSTEPLREFLEEALSPVDGELTGIDYNLGRGSLKAAAIITTSYSTGQSVVWVQGRDIETWERPQRRSVSCRLTVEHILASTALPLFFPAIRVGEEWFGDGGIRLAAPLSPALHLGAHKVLAISTRYPSTRSEADRRVVEGYSSAGPGARRALQRHLPGSDRPGRTSDGADEPPAAAAADGAANGDAGGGAAGAAAVARPGAAGAGS